MSVAAATGVARLARFRADGLAAFDATPTGLLNALAPWLAFALVTAVLLLVTGETDHALADLLGSVVVLLAPPVVSHGLARLWHREARWLRYAVAFTWCQWVMPAALLAALLGAGMLMAAGLAEDVAQTVAMLALLAYALALHVFLARRALDVSAWKAAGMVVAVNLGTAAVVFLPTLVAALVGRPA